MSSAGGQLVPMPKKKIELTHPGYQPAGSRDELHMHLSPAIMAHVARHVLRWCVPALAAQRPMRTLCIVGRAGEGKSTALAVALSRLRVDAILVPSSKELSGEHEGEPAEALDNLAAIVRSVLSTSIPRFATSLT